MPDSAPLPEDLDMTDLRQAPATLEDMPPLFHWAPTPRRRQIDRYGLRPGMRPTISTPGWRAPYVCLAETPSWAWALSGQRHEDAAEPGSWDLWQVDVNGLTGAVIPTYDDDHQWHEVRIHERIHKRRMWRVASRLIPDRSQGEPE
jgi:hypothetical protein